MGLGTIPQKGSVEDAIPNANKWQARTKSVAREKTIRTVAIEPPHRRTPNSRAKAKHHTHITVERRRRY